MVYYNPDHYGWSISIPYSEEEEEGEEDSPSRKQKNKKNNVEDSEAPTLEQEKSTHKKPAIKSIKKRVESLTSIIEKVKQHSNQFEDKGDN